MEVKLHKNYLLIYSSKKDLAILKRNGLQFSLLWQKQYNSLKNLIELDFSLDGKYLVSDFDMIWNINRKVFNLSSNTQKTKNKQDRLYRLYRTNDKR